MAFPIAKGKPMSTNSFENTTLKSFNLGKKIKLCTQEREVEDVYNEGLSFYFPKSVIEHPYNCDGYLQTSVSIGKLLKLIIEYKYNYDLNRKTILAKILIQVIYYLKKFENNGALFLPNVVMVGEKKGCFVLHTNSLIKYLDYPLDWNIAPSNAGEKYPDLVLEITQNEEINPFVFSIDDSFDFKCVIEKIYDLCNNVKRYIHITEHTIVKVFEDFRDRINIGKAKISVNELVSCFIGCITNDDSYFLHPKKKNILVTPNGNIPVNSDKLESFFSYYSREYTTSEKRKFTEVADRLIEDTTRRKQGAFYTPQRFIDYAHSMITRHLGDDWKEEYVVYDCCAGTLNLTRDYHFKELYCSTLLQSELDMGKKYNPEAKKWQMDFLNDPEEGIDRNLIKAMKENKPIIFFINPPYGTACTYDNNSKGGINNTAIRDKMNKTKFGGSENLQHQFMYRITKLVEKYNLTNAYFALFSKPIWLSGAKQGIFLKNFTSRWECKDAYLFQASHFADVSDTWGISLTLWKANSNATPITEYKMKLIDILDDGSIDVIGHHTIYNSYGKIKASDWVKEPIRKLKTTNSYPATTSGLVLKENNVRASGIVNQFGYYLNNANSIQDNQQKVAMFSTTYGNGNGLGICKENFTRCTSLFTARKLIIGNWINDKDEYLSPNEQHPKWKRFEADSIIYSLFHSSSNQTSLRKINYKGGIYDIPNHFFWMSKEEIKELADKNGDDYCFHDATVNQERYLYTFLQTKEIKDNLSDKAKLVLELASTLVKETFKYRTLFEETHPNHQIHTFDCGYYQQKDLWKEYAPDLFKKFKETYKNLADELKPLVYTLGFLKQ